MVLIVPITTCISLYFGGWLSFSTLIFAFVIVPLLELLISPDSHNLSFSYKQSYSINPFFNGMLWISLPIYVFLTGYALSIFSQIVSVDIFVVGQIISCGLLCGILAINTGHELGHRHTKFERTLGELLLTFSLQAHFLPYHNHGHHRLVATSEDPATARLNETVYLFWIRSQVGSFIEAWRIEWRRLTQKQHSPFSLKNRMLKYTLWEVTALLGIGIFWGIGSLAAFIAICFVGMLLLETVNYIEHYGLLRAQDKNGKYERVSIKHSWNSNHRLGRLLLFELSRHSDHHANPGKHYQLLDSHPKSPQMPTGYPGMMLLSLLPTIWFKVMNKRVIKAK